eukprot:augustus_masked-scaffold_11-processed-gene-10.53-mRNA-1 protein AED:1.00 eAED:1.00 QI:0/0/0/0/1/1/2/0/212
MLKLPLSKEFKFDRQVFVRWRFARVHEANLERKDSVDWKEVHNLISVGGIRIALMKLRDVLTELLTLAMKGHVEMNECSKEVHRLVRVRFRGMELVIGDCCSRNSITHNLVHMDVEKLKLTLYVWNKPMGVVTHRVKVQKYLESVKPVFYMVGIDPSHRMFCIDPVRGSLIIYNKMTDIKNMNLDLSNLETGVAYFIWTLPFKKEVTLELMK